ncbi:DUF1541 domain-containing protein, partial [Staphylococcus epidermidis]
MKHPPKHPFTNPDTLKLQANHISRMKRATPIIDNLKKTTLYVLDYKSK